MTRVLVTGATGFIGQAVLPLLVARWDEVHGVTSGRSPIPQTGGVEWHKADLLAPEQSTALLRALRPEHLLHLAWYAVPGKWLTSIENVRWVEASLRLIREFAAAGGDRVVVAGSCAEYDLFHGLCSEEATPLQPRGLYGSCKHALHSIIEASSAELGVRVAWARIFSVYGPAENPHRLVASVIRSLLDERPAVCAYGGHQRDYLHSHDVGSALAHILGADIDGAVNIGSGTPVALNRLVAAVGEQMGRSHLVEVDDRAIAPTEPPIVVADIRRLREVAGWKPALDLATGIRQTVEWWRANA